MKRLIQFLLVSFSTIVLCGCNPFETTEKGSGSDVEATVVVGSVVDSNDNPQVGVLVRLRESDFLAKVASDEVMDNTITRDTVTDKLGRYGFGGVNQGQYSIEVDNRDELGTHTHVDVSEQDKLINLPPDTLYPLVTLAGTVEVNSEEKGAPELVTIQVYGLERYAEPDSAGAFEIKLPKGDFKIRVADEVLTFDEIELPIHVRRGKPMKPHKFRLGDRCGDYACDSTTVAEMTRYLGMETLAVSDVTLKKDNRVVEVYLRDRGLNRMPAKLVKLNRLEVLDLGRNYIHKVMLKGLRRLRVLHLDGNQLKELRRDVADLDSLKQLDLSDNGLKILPDDISVLHLDYLNLSNNKLCDLTDTVANWADIYDPGWRQRQRCE